MIAKEEVLDLLKSTESYRVERTTSTGNMDKFCEAICAFANDMPASRKNGYLIIGAYDDGTIAGMKVDDALLKKIAGIRSDGNILPLPTMSVERFTYPEGDLLVAEVHPSDLPPVRYRGRVFIRIGPRRDIATEAEERILAERRCSFMATFDATPCLSAKLEDLDVDYIKSSYLPMAFDEATLANDKRDIKEQLASIHLYDRDNDCPTYAGIILFGKNPKYFLLGDYVQFVRFAGQDKGGDILNERQFAGPLYKMLPTLESFVRDGIITQRPVPETLFRERTVWNYPEGAIRELLMNACMHRDYQANMPIRLYQFDNYIEVMNAGGLYGEARPENFPSVNDYRNPLVAEAMRVMKYVNKFNRGVTRVQEMLKENGNSLAEFDVNTITAFRVTVHTTNESDLSDSHKSDTSQTDKTIEEKIIEFCKEPRSLAEIMTYLGYKDKTKFKKKYINPLLNNGLTMSIPEKPNSRSQKYFAQSE
ncbi:MAG: putative DNA binding domain-containing protein [Muribaculaceae bacterium]|nr:putative DNA binding domain-containing protein [Muribaculaceae bacterium]